MCVCVCVYIYIHTQTHTHNMLLFFTNMKIHYKTELLNLITQNIIIIIIIIICTHIHKYKLKKYLSTHTHTHTNTHIYTLQLHLIQHIWKHTHELLKIMHATMFRRGLSLSINRLPFACLYLTSHGCFFFIKQPFCCIKLHYQCISSHLHCTLNIRLP